MKTKPREDDQIARWLGEAPGRPERHPVLDALDALHLQGPASHNTQAAQARLRGALADLRRRSVWYASIDSRFGRICFAATEAGLVAVSIGERERAFAAGLRARFRVEPALAPGALAAIGGQLREYATGERSRFDMPLDLRAAPEFQRKVLREALAIPRGQVSTYSEIARRIGRPKASRAVGQALGHNPIPLVIPCHRVVGSDGKLHGYGTGRGVQTKAQLLRWEGAGAFAG